MDAQIAAQFLGTIAQVTVTLFAVYLAIIVYVFQDREIAKALLKNRYFIGAFGISCVDFGCVIALLFEAFLTIGPERPLDNTIAFGMIGLFSILFTMTIITYVAILLERKYRAK